MLYSVEAVERLCSAEIKVEKRSVGWHGCLRATSLNEQTVQKLRRDLLFSWNNRHRLLTLVSVTQVANTAIKHRLFTHSAARTIWYALFFVVVARFLNICDRRLAGFCMLLSTGLTHV